MDIDIARIAAATAATLAPFTPFLLEAGKAAGKKLAETIATKGGEAAWNKARALWEQIQHHAPGDAKINGAAMMVFADPEDESSQAILAKALGARLEQDSTLAGELLDLLGGKTGLQEVIADQGSWIEDVVQAMEGSGTQTVKASDDSVIKGVRQIKK